MRAAAGARAARRGRAAAPPGAAAAGAWHDRAPRSSLALLVVAGLGVAAVYGARQVYFLGIDEGGRVALYRGLPYDLPLGIELYTEVYSVPGPGSTSLPEDRRDERHRPRAALERRRRLADRRPRVAAVERRPQPPAAGRQRRGRQRRGHQAAAAGGRAAAATRPAAGGGQAAAAGLRQPAELTG